MSDFVILAGPTLAVDPAASRYFSCLLPGKNYSTIATIEQNPKAKERLLRIDSGLSDEASLASVMGFVTMIVASFKGAPDVIAEGAHAVTLAASLSQFIASSNPDIVKAWVSLNFVVECTGDSTNSLAKRKSNTVRFVGTHISGLKAIASASNVRFTISGK